MKLEERSFLGAVTNNAINVFHNVDGAKFEKLDIINDACNCCDRRPIPIAELYKTNVVKDFFLKSHLFFTSREAVYGRSDAARRTIYLTVADGNDAAKEREAILESRFLAKLKELYYELLVRLGRILAALHRTKEERLESQSTLRDFEHFTYQCAKAEGWIDQAEEMWKAFALKYREQISSNSSLEPILIWLGNRAMSEENSRPAAYSRNLSKQARRRESPCHSSPGPVLASGSLAAPTRITKLWD